MGADTKPKRRRRLAVVVAAVALMGTAIAASGEPEHKEGAPAHHTTSGFRNPPGSPGPGPAKDRLPWLFKRLAGGFPEGELPPGHVIPPEEAKLALAATDGRDSVTWIGHMTALLRLGGVTVLTDPWFSDRASPLPGMGPKRMVPPGIAMADLPPIDLVILSHNHYDHLDLASLDALPDRDRITAVVPLGLGGYFTDRDFGRVIELDWYEATRAKGLTVTALPAIHWSKRGLWDRNKTLWAAFALESADGMRVYFGGDSEYGPVFKETGEHYGGFDAALISIGAYLPRAMMRGNHCTPEGGLRIGLDLGAQTLIGMHWGTILLGDDGPTQAAEAFRQAGRDAGLPDERVWLMRIGETRELKRRPVLETISDATPLATEPPRP